MQYTGIAQQVKLRGDLCQVVEEYKKYIAANNALNLYNQ